jgi:Leucine-rich repeat (LRR) protein
VFSFPHTLTFLPSVHTHSAGFLLDCTAVDFFTEVSKLDSLKDLELSGNTLLKGSLGTAKTSQALPPLCSAVQNGLEIINLDTTGINGEVPSCLFAEASSLRELSLTNTQETFLEDGFSTASKLEVLRANKVAQMARIPPTLAFLPSLRRLSMSENGMKGQVPQFSSNNLQEVDLSKNELTGGIPHSLTTHPSLIKLDLSFNNLTTLPIEWKSLVYTNPINAPFPLEEIILSNNNIQNPFPGGLAYYPSLSKLDISDNQLEGPVEDYPKGFEAMQSLDISNNQLSGSYPAWMRNVNNLQSRNSGLDRAAANSESDTSNDNADGDSSGLSGGAIAGIVIGSLCGVALIGIVAILVVKKADLKRGKWKWQPQHLLPTNGDGRFERFSDESDAVELGRRGNTLDS